MICAFDDCGKEFKQRSNGHKYCSTKCRYAHRKQSWVTHLEPRACACGECGETFQPRNNEQRYIRGHRDAVLKKKPKIVGNAYHKLDKVVSKFANYRVEPLASEAVRQQNADILAEQKRRVRKGKLVPIIIKSIRTVLSKYDDDIKDFDIYTGGE